MFAKKGLKKIVVGIYAAYISINTYVGSHSNSDLFKILNVQHALIKAFSSWRWLLFLVIIGGLTFFSFFAFYAKSEGNLGDNPFKNFMADGIVVFGFPMFNLFEEFFGSSPLLVLVGFFINILFYSLALELLVCAFFYITKMRRVKSTFDSQSQA